MNIYLELLLLTAIIVFVVDLSGIVDTLKDALSRWLNIKLARLRPIDCSLCMTFWCGLAYIAIKGCFNIGMVAYVCALSFSTTTIAAELRLALDTLQTLTDLFWKLIDRLKK